LTECFFCRFLAGGESAHNRSEDIVLRTRRTTAFVSPRMWPANRGNVIVIPNEHIADLESADDDLLGELFGAARQVALAMRTAYGCEGTSTRQHNGMAAGQEVDHLHVHVFPRYVNDGLYERNREHRFAPAEERADYADRLRRALTR
jgi:histidine triad (HIT) family protein